MLCTSGHDNSVDARFCTSCGVALTPHLTAAEHASPAPPNVGAVATTSTEQQRSVKRWFTPKTIGLAIVAVLLFTVKFHATSVMPGSSGLYSGPAIFILAIFGIVMTRRRNQRLTGRTVGLGILVAVLVAIAALAGFMFFLSAINNCASNAVC